MNEKYGRLDARTWHELIGIVIQLEAEKAKLLKANAELADEYATALEDSKRLDKLERILSRDNLITIGFQPPLRKAIDKRN